MQWEGQGIYTDPGPGSYCSVAEDCCWYGWRHPWLSPATPAEPAKPCCSNGSTYTRMPAQRGLGACLPAACQHVLHLPPAPAAGSCCMRRHSWPRLGGQPWCRPPALPAPAEPGAGPPLIGSPVQGMSHTCPPGLAAPDAGMTQQASLWALLTVWRSSGPVWPQPPSVPSFARPCSAILQDTRPQSQWYAPLNSAEHPKARILELQESAPTCCHWGAQGFEDTLKLQVSSWNLRCSVRGSASKSSTGSPRD